MPQLMLASINRAPATQWAHDIRNTLATVGLHLDTLARLSGSRGREVVDAAHALMARAASMCNDAMQQSAADSACRGFDVAKTMSQVANLLRPIVPEGFELRVAGQGAFVALADPQAVFRILFNLTHNAVTAARHGAAMTHVTLLAERIGSRIVLRVADDGPGLPQCVRENLFRPGDSATSSSGIGLSIARELAERNGATLQLAESARGTTFVLELPGVAAMPADTGAMRSLGRRAGEG